MSGEQYDEDYFLRGKQTGKSLYTDYHWMPEATIPMVKRIVDHCGITPADTVLDFGCARGYVVKALHKLGHSAFGVDVSEWAIANADEQVKPFVNCITQLQVPPVVKYDWIIAKDVLEHVEYVWWVIRDLIQVAKKGLFVVVPLSAHDGQPYVIGDYELDKTHRQRMVLTTWTQMFMRVGWAVTAQYRLPGVKDNWYRPGWEKGNGFITARRVEE